jgi:hypothetical protein
MMPRLGLQMPSATSWRTRLWGVSKFVLWGLLSLALGGMGGAVALGLYLNNEWHETCSPMTPDDVAAWTTTLGRSLPADPSDYAQSLTRFEQELAARASTVPAVYVPAWAICATVARITMEAK